MSSCQHDALLPDCTMEIQLNWQGSRIVCLGCLRAAFVTKRGRITDADPPEHVMTAPETKVGCEGKDGLLRIHAADKTCEVCAPEVCGCPRNNCTCDPG